MMLGRQMFFSFINEIWLWFQLGYFSFRSFFREDWESISKKIPVFKVIFSQIYFTAWQALGLVFLMGLFIGFLFISQMINFQFGFGNLDGIIKIFTILIFREFGPVLVALIVIARSGTAVAIELGNMKVNREIEALLSMGIHPFQYVVFPRIVGGIFSMFVLGIYFVFSSLLGAVIASSILFKISFDYFLIKLSLFINVSDYFLLILKYIGGGFIIFTISSYYGLSVKGSVTEVPVVVTKSVLKSIFLVLFLNFSIMAIYYLRFF